MGKCLYCYKDNDIQADYHVECSRAFFGTEQAPKIPYSLNDMTELAKQVVERSISVPGVQPKLSMAIFTEAKAETRLTVVGALGGQYIFKPPSVDFEEMPANEHLTMKLAEALNIDVVPHALIRLASGELSYITKRIDRAADGEKTHMIDMFQILEAFDKYRGSMERIGKAISMYAEHTLLDKLRFFEITIFSFLTGNNDMHLKNFSMIKKSFGWALSPAYDLLNVNIVNPEDAEELALTISGKKKKITKEILINFGLQLELSQKQIDGVFNRFSKNKLTLLNIINNSFLSESMRSEYIDVLEERYKRLKE
ncbi:HipA domain-containing protein [Formosa agariphila KMM 3901]|uniref:HipA domain-containing protein n=1 Tax=Formosa agariphila (strain DSM 15362 / KCTC 12365 / LMG 23005 / KMM 3901 / M-2Alg 35-1) TaxID=1347342 RepID=T2KQS4_FORAG|nr:HipA domain-containing protein [Formosa agariphila]CDF80324.1 HipA domain-containing protein [Formosa agariphila KMM 3901]